MDIISHQVFSKEEHERGFDLAYFIPLVTVAATLEEFRQPQILG